MTNIQTIQMPIHTVFQMFSHQEDCTMTKDQFLQFVSYIFDQFGITRTPDIHDVQILLNQFNITKETSIRKQDFNLPQSEMLRFRVANGVQNDEELIKIAVQPLIEEVQKSGQTEITRQSIQILLTNIYCTLNIPQPVSEKDIDKFIMDFDKNADGILQTSDFNSIQYLKFKVKKCRRIQ